ncbi:DNA polymerase/3'-5' exonuclease PolX [Alkaliphilus peptidifermentans]|uniref:DNA polymerase beta n=1 Tax=Alkaliphilus peptidifermentans DSM 18978 TaxID=1120976 RepID=A0A1G5CMR0_9FIRM|nr:DNA polymerase/3'-5' exonuclease PolX [Alkaliphilus peptidifermentans]SCY03765.1 DNA polymerase (family 10) [Alkaliphilus peptidifermentans DSM 18978]
MDKNEISIILEEIGTLLELKGENPFKVRAYYNGARTVEMLEEDLNQLIKENRLQEVKGVGKALVEKITELVTTGKLAFYDELKESTPPGLLEMLRIPGVGPKKISVLYKDLGIKAVDELEDACLQNRLVSIKGFGEKTQKKILEGIENYKNYKNQFLISTGLNYGTYIYEQLKELPQVQRISLAGSIRRFKEVIKDIDLIVSCEENNIDYIMDYFTNLEGVARVTGRGITKCSITLDVGMNVDMRIVNDEAFPNALQHFTGSKEHNTALRHRGKQMGYKINEYGLFNGEEKVYVGSEEDIYNILKLQYIPPEIRENNGEIEAAELNDIPKLVDLDLIKGVFHVHSNYSDGKNTIEELVKAAIDKGFKYIGISDHSKSAIYAGGLKEQDIVRQHEEINNLRVKYSNITILKGIESDILLDGSLDYDENTLESFDYVIGSIHSSFNIDGDLMTERMLRAIKNKHLKILGHVTGRLLLSRNGYGLDLKKIINACAENKVAIEINSNPHRLDLDWRMCRYAKEQGVRLVIEPDAHKIEGLDHIFYGIGVARKGWLEAIDVLNTSDINEVREFFKG